MVGVHLHLKQFWLLNLESIKNTVIQRNILSPSAGKTKPRKRYSHIGPTCAKGLKRKDESSLRLIKNSRRTDYRDAKLAFTCAW